MPVKAYSDSVVGSCSRRIGTRKPCPHRLPRRLLYIDEFCSQTFRKTIKIHLIGTRRLASSDCRTRDADSVYFSLVFVSPQARRCVLFRPTTRVYTPVGERIYGRFIGLYFILPHVLLFYLFSGRRRRCFFPCRQ